MTNSQNSKQLISKHFTFDELKCKKTGILRLQKGFIDSLEELREAWGHPMIVNSCCRSVEHNREVGGADNSYHIFDATRRTCAIDIDVCGWNAQYVEHLIWLAGQKGWSVGSAEYFIHLDKRTDYNPVKPVFFTYPKKTKENKKVA